MTGLYFRKCLSYTITGISVTLIGLLLIPVGILSMLIFILWTSTDEILRLLEEKMNYEKWAFHDITPISRQLIQKLIYAILSNELSSGNSIPSVREMAEILHINPNTVLKSYKAVKQEHLIICSKDGKYSVTQDYDYIQQVKLTQNVWQQELSSRLKLVRTGRIF